MSLGGDPSAYSCEGAIDKNWGPGGPGSPIPSDKFSVRWAGTFDFAAGETTFTAVADDGIRVFVDGSLVIDAWNDHAATMFTATRALSAGSHPVVVEYYENGGEAVAKLSWSSSSPPTTSAEPAASAAPAPAAAPAADPEPSPAPSPSAELAPSAAPVPSCSSGEYLATFYDNVSLDGAPVLARCESAVNGDWGAEGPGAPLPADNFSARWEGTFEFGGGKRTFTVRADDGMRLWVDGKTVIDAWKDQAVTTYTSTVTLSKGAHTVRVDYYEKAGEAVATAGWDS
jgi:hypothetical protein